MLNMLGIFDLSVLTDAERLNYAEKRHYFWFGEVTMASVLANLFAVPVGFPCGPGGDDPCIHRGGGPVPAALRISTQTDPAGYEGRCGCSDRDIREERAG